MQKLVPSLIPNPWCCKIQLLRLLLTVALLLATVLTCAAADLRLIEAKFLRASAGSWVILDARPKTEWESGHIPGAIPFYWESFTRTDAKGVKYASLTPEELAAELSGLGIDEKTPLVIYGDANKSWGSEGYGVWLFTWLGHKGPIRLLRGGIQAWTGSGHPIVKGIRWLPARKAHYLADPKSQYLVSTEGVLHHNGLQLVDVRSTFEWFSGRIPGAVHIPWDDFYTGKDRHPLPPDELKKLLEKHGVDPSRPVAYYCLGGVRSAYAWTVHQLSGLPDARNYKGSWAAWEKRGQ